MILAKIKMFDSSIALHAREREGIESESIWNDDDALSPFFTETYAYDRTVAVAVVGRPLALLELLSRVDVFNISSKLHPVIFRACAIVSALFLRSIITDISYT